MGEEETYTVNDTMRSIRKIKKHLSDWAFDNASASQRHVAMVFTKLEEAELLCQRIVKDEE